MTLESMRISTDQGFDRRVDGANAALDIVGEARVPVRCASAQEFYQRFACGGRRDRDDGAATFDFAPDRGLTRTFLGHGGSTLDVTTRER